MGNQQGLYPGYDVLAHKEEWDENTRRIVLRRLGPFSYTFLSEWEQEMIKAAAGHVAYEDRGEILAWIAAHVDQELAGGVGEDQRQPGIPPQAELVRDGLTMIENWAKQLYGSAFLEATADQQLQILQGLQLGQLPAVREWGRDRQKALFKKLAGLVVDAYYSHPWVWSEIGYGGPAYPRGYVRVELGLADPWEPPLATRQNSNEEEPSHAEIL